MPPEILLGADATQPPLPNAKVLGVKPEIDAIVISIGANAGVKPGYRFTVSRGADFVASAEVDKVYAEMSLAKVVNKKGEIQMYDDVRSPR